MTSLRSFSAVASSSPESARRGRGSAFGPTEPGPERGVGVGRRRAAHPARRPWCRGRRAVNRSSPELCRPGRCCDLGFARLGSGEGDVPPHGRVEQVGVLSDPGDHAPGSLLTETLSEVPPSVASPASSAQKRSSVFTTLLLPAPLGPTRATRRSAGIDIVRPSRAQGLSARSGGSVFQDDVGFRRLGSGSRDRRPASAARRSQARGARQPGGARASTPASATGGTISKAPSVTSGRTASM